MVLFSAISRLQGALEQSFAPGSSRDLHLTPLPLAHWVLLTQLVLKAGQGSSSVSGQTGPGHHPRFCSLTLGSAPPLVLLIDCGMVLEKLLGIPSCGAQRDTSGSTSPDWESDVFLTSHAIFLLPAFLLLLFSFCIKTGMASYLGVQICLAVCVPSSSNRYQGRP